MMRRVCQAASLLTCLALSLMLAGGSLVTMDSRFLLIGMAIFFAGASLLLAATLVHFRRRDSRVWMDLSLLTALLVVLNASALLPPPLLNTVEHLIP